MRWKQIIGLGSLVAISILGFQNCGSDFVVRSDLQGSFSSSSICEANLQAQFASSYHSFLKTTCVACHTGAGPGNGAFANANAAVAFPAFLLATSSKIDTYALNSSHASGVTGSQNASAIAVASQAWKNASQACAAGGTGGTGSAPLSVNPKIMNAAATAKDLVWNLDTEVTGVPTILGGATLTVGVRKETSANGTTVYYLSNPRLKAGTKTVHLAGLMAIINGQTQSLGSTYSRVDGTATAGQSIQLSAAQMILEYSQAAATDTLSFSIDTLE